MSSRKVKKKMCVLKCPVVSDHHWNVNEPMHFLGNNFEMFTLVIVQMSLAAIKKISDGGLLKWKFWWLNWFSENMKNRNAYFFSVIVFVYNHLILNCILWEVNIEIWTEYKWSSATWWLNNQLISLYLALLTIQKYKRKYATKVWTLFDVSKSFVSWKYALREVYYLWNVSSKGQI